MYFLAIAYQFMSYHSILLLNNACIACLFEFVKNPTNIVVFTNNTNKNMYPCMLLITLLSKEKKESGFDWNLNAWIWYIITDVKRKWLVRKSLDKHRTYYSYFILFRCYNYYLKNMMFCLSCTASTERLVFPTSTHTY